MNNHYDSAIVPHKIVHNVTSHTLDLYGAYNMTKLFEFELCKFELLTSVI